MTAKLEPTSQVQKDATSASSLKDSTTFIGRKVTALVADLSNTIKNVGQKVLEGKEALDAAASTIKKGVKVFAQEKWAESEREKGFRFLSELLGQEKLETLLPQFVPLLSQWADENNGLNTIAEPVVIFAMHNLARKLFPQEAVKIDQQQLLNDDEKVSIENFVATVSIHLFGLIKEELVRIDSLYEAQGSLVQADFEPLTTKILTELLPEEKGLDTIKNYAIRVQVREILLDGFENIYMSVILGKNSKKTAEKNWVLPKGFLSLFVSAIADHMLKKEESFFAKLNGSDEMSKECSSLMDTLDDSSIQKLLSFLPFLKEMESTDIKLAGKALLMRCLGNVIRSKTVEVSALNIEDTLQIVAVELKAILVDCFEGANSLREQNKSIKSKHFIHGATQLIHLLFPNEHVLMTLLLRRFPIINATLAGRLMDFDNAFNKTENEQFDHRLRVLVWEPERFKKEYPNLHIPEVPDANTSKVLGVENFIVQMHNLSNNVAAYACKEMEKALRNWQKQPQLGYKKILNQVLSLILNEEASSIKFKKQLESHLAAIFFKMLIIWLEKGRQEGSPLDATLFNSFKLLIDTITRNAPEIEKQLDESPENLSVIYKPLTCDLIKLAFNSLEEHLPFPKEVAEPIANLITAQVLPTCLAHLYNSSHVWIVKRDENRKQLHELYHNHRMAGAAKLLAHYAEQYIPFFLRDQSALSASVTLGSISRFMVKGPNEEVQIAQELHPKFSTMVETAILSIGQAEQSEFKVPFSFIRSYVEAFLLQAFLNASQSIEKMEIAHKEGITRFYEGATHVQAGKVFLKEARSHFSLYNSVKEKYGKTHASEIPEKVMLTNFDAVENQLHPLLKTDNAEVRKQIYRGLSNKLLGLMQFSEKEGLPSPALLKGRVWQLFQKDLFPLITESVVNISKSPQAIENYLNSLLKIIKRSLTDEETRNSIFENLPQDALQREIESIAGGLFEELIGLQPSIVKPLIRQRSLRDKVGKVVGESMRGVLEKQTPLELFDQLVQNGLPLLHPEGGWVTNQAHRTYQQSKEKTTPAFDLNGDVFFPIRVDENGKKVRGWDFHFPKNEKEKQQQEAQLKVNRQALRRELDERLADMIEHQAYLSFDAAVAGMWKEFQSTFDKKIYATFGKEGARLKKTFDEICNFIWNFVLKPVLRLLGYPLKDLIQYLLHLYFVHQADIRVRDVQSPINQNLFLRTLDQTVNLLVERKAKVAAPIST